jgi:hypothetical protein
MWEYTEPEGSCHRDEGCFTCAALGPVPARPCRPQSVVAMLVGDDLEPTPSEEPVGVGSRCCSDVLAESPPPGRDGIPPDDAAVHWRVAARVFQVKEATRIVRIAAYGPGGFGVGPSAGCRHGA